jgi:hypothetical protein
MELALQQALRSLRCNVRCSDGSQRSTTMIAGSSRHLLHLGVSEKHLPEAFQIANRSRDLVRWSG